MKTAREWMKRIAMLSVFVAMQCVAAPFAEWLEGRSPLGAAVRIWAEGDEYSASFEAEDGHAVVFDSKSLTYFYAHQAKDGSLVSTGIAVGDETISNKDALAAIPLHLRDTSQAAAEERAKRIAKAEEELGITERWNQLKATAHAQREFEEKKASGVETGVLKSPPSSPTLGNIVGLTLLIDFPMTNAYGVVTNTLSKAYHPDVTLENLSELLNGENCTLYGNASSVRKYFEDVSCDKLSYTNIVIGWFTAAHPREYYDDPTQGNGPSAQELIGEVLAQIASAPDYQTKYLPLLRQVSYSGSYFRALNVWFAGPSAKYWSKGLWAHQWGLDNIQSNLLPVETSDGTKYFSTYQISPVTSSPCIGTFCHENGHMICDFPDLYNTSTADVGDSTGPYCLMNSASGTNPIYVSAYLRAAAGWVTPMELPSAPSLLAVTNRRDSVWRYTNPFDSKQYYLIENRQKKGRDSGLPGGGILIWRCDETGDNTEPKKLAGFDDDAVFRVSSELSLEQADGLYELEKNKKSWDPNDLWFSGNSAAGYCGVFHAESSPCAKWRDASNAAILLSHFSAKGDVMTFFSGDTGEYERPLVVSGLKSKGFSSMTFSVVASAIGRNASRLMVYADIASTSGGVTTQRSDYLGDISDTGVEMSFTVSGLQVGAQHTVKLRFVQSGGEGAVIESGAETLLIENDSSIAAAVGASDIPFWHDSDTYRWASTSAAYHSSPSSAVSGNKGVQSSQSILHAGVAGPGTFSFYWKVSSESERYDWLEVSFDGSSETNKIGGTGGTWSPVSLRIPAGEHVVTWVYRKDYSVDGGDDCGWIDTVVWDPDEADPPDTPTGLSATQGTNGDGVSLSWNAVAFTRKYAVWRSSTSSLSSASLIGETLQPRYLDMDASPNTTFWYWVKAVNMAGESGFSGSASGWCPAPLVVTTTSLAYGTVGSSFSRSVSATGGRSSLTWSLGEGAVLPPGINFSSSGMFSGTPTAPWIGDVLVAVTDANGTVAYGAVAVEIRSNTAPSAIAGLTATPDYGRMALSWEAQAGVSEYVVYRSESNSFLSATEIGRIVNTNFIDDGISEGVTYRYWIVGVNWLGSGPQGNAISARLKDTTIPGDLFVHAASGDDANDGSSWAKAKRSIQSAVDLAKSQTGCMIVVAPGRYDPISSTDNVSMSIQAIEGPSVTVIDGNFTNRCATLTTSYDGTNVFLSGFTLANGCVSNFWNYSYGGGSYGGTLSHCVISNCTALSVNYSAYGGGSYFGVLRNCLIVSNRVESLADANSYAYGGGGHGSKLYNCTVVGNMVRSASGIESARGGGTYSGSAYNSIIAGNGALSRDSALYGGEANALSTSQYNSYVGGAHIFADAENGDWRLSSSSPCVNAGSADYVVDDLDLAGNPRIDGGIVDMGAFEGSIAPVAAPAPVRKLRGRTDSERSAVLLHWTPSAQTESYEIYRGASANPSAARLIGETSSCEFLDTEVSLGVTYRYWAVPKNSVGSGSVNDAQMVEVTVEEDGADFYVDGANGNDVNDGKTWATAKRTIRAAALLVDDGDLVLVAPGTYEPFATYDVRCEVRSVGGADVTFVDGGATNRCATLSLDKSTSSVLTGFTLCNGIATGLQAWHGGGSSGGTLNWCVISNCQAVADSGSSYAYGGGAYYGNLYNCRISGNIVMGNKAYGGGACGSYLYGCLVDGNEARSSDAAGYAYGGGVYMAYSYNSTIVGNSAVNTAGGKAQGGGTYGYYHYSSIFWDNTAAVGPNLAANSNTRLYNCCTQEANNWCYSNTITANPLFVDAAHGDWRLSSGSPCLDAGNNNHAKTELDIQGTTRIQNGKVDIGAFEGAYSVGEETVRPLQITTAFLPVGRVGAAYSATLAASGGVSPCRWSAPLSYHETRESASSLPTGTAQGFKGDEMNWLMSLPFEFPFFDGRYSSVWIQSNGALTFDGTRISYSSVSLSTLKSHIMIAPLCDDLDTSSGDIYVASSSSEITIRWAGIYWNGKTEVSFAVTLYADGTIRMRYGSGNANGGMIGLSDGSGSNYVISNSSQSGSMSGANDIVFTPAGLPAGMALSENGVFSGTPSGNGSHQFSVIVTDAIGQTAIKPLVFVVENTGASTETTPISVPHAWLNSYPELFSSSGGDYEAMANAQSPGVGSGGKKWPDGSPYYVWQDFVAGTSPTNDTVFTATIRMEGNTPVVTWEPDTSELRATRVYRTLGKKTLLDVNWTDITDIDQSEYHFFKVTVDLP